LIFFFFKKDQACLVCLLSTGDFQLYTLPNLQLIKGQQIFDDHDHEK